MPEDTKPAVVETEPTDGDDADGEEAAPDKTDWRDAQDNPWVPDEEAPPPVIGS